MIINKSTVVCLLGFLGFAFSNDVQAQNGLFNHGSITLQEGASIHVEGDVVNVGNSAINNEGTLHLQGDWENASNGSVFTENKGIVYFNGSGEQYIIGEKTKFGGLSIQNSEQVTLLTDVAVSQKGFVNIENSSLTLNGNHLEINNPSSNSVNALNGGIVSEDEDALVNWYVGKTIDSYTIPFVTEDGSAIPMTVMANSDDNGKISASTFATDRYNNQKPLGVSNLKVNGKEDGLQMVDRYWYLELDNKSADVALSYSKEDIEENEISLERLFAVQWDNLDRSWVKSDGDNYNMLDDQTYVASSAKSGYYTLAASKSSLNLDVYPVPAVDNLNVDVYISEEDLEGVSSAFVTILDEYGRVLQTEKVQINSEKNKLSLNVSTLPIAQYLVHVKIKDKVLAKKFVKEDKH